MELNITLGNDSLSINIDNPYQINIDSLMIKIKEYASSKNIKLDGIDLRGLLPKMIKGVAGCESGCPSNAKNLVYKGFKNFELDYIEGGILSAKVSTGDGKTLYLKIFPDF